MLAMFIQEARERPLLETPKSPSGVSAWVDCPVPGTNLCRDWVDSTESLVKTSAEDLALAQFEFTGEINAEMRLLDLESHHFA